MKQKNGFTLLELLGVIVILVLLVTMVSPIIQKEVKKSQKTINEAQIENIKAAANDWAIDHPDSLPTVEGRSITITLSTLQDGWYISENLKDTKTNTEINGNLQITITYEKKHYTYQVK